MSYEKPGLKFKIIEKLLSIFLNERYVDFMNLLKLKGNEKILEFGSGGGRLSKHIVKKLNQSGELYCVDVSEHWQKVIKRRLKQYNNVCYFLGNLAYDRFDARDFDVVLIHYVFHHLPKEDQAKTAQKLYNLMKQGAFIYLREPLNHHHHDSPFRATDAKKIFEDTGFLLVEEFEGVQVKTDKKIFTQIFKKN